MKLVAIGFIRSDLRDTSAAPKQGREGAPDAWLEVDPAFERALSGMKAGDRILVVTWLHLADRAKLEVHPRGNRRNPLTGVFSTRSQHRPNPLGLHHVTVRRIDGRSLLVGPIEAIDGTPVVDMKTAEA